MKLLLLIVGLTTIMSCTRQSPAQKAESQENLLPEFDILLTDTITKINTAKIPEGKPIVLFFFGPDCPHCEALTKDIIAHIDSLKDIRFFLLSIAGFHEIKAYETHLQLNKYSNITVGQDYSNYLLSYYKAPGVPFLVVYDKNKKLKQTIVGGVGLDSIKTVIKK
jgi:thioredoxin-related protein